MENKNKMKRSEYVKSKEDFWWKYVERPKRIIESVWNKIWGIDIEKELKEEVDKHRFELVTMPFDNSEIVRLLGLCVGEEDYYYVALKESGEIYYCTCVGGFTPLIKSMDKFTYYHMERLWDMNMDKSIEEVLEGFKKDNNEIIY